MASPAVVAASVSGFSSHSESCALSSATIAVIDHRSDRLAKIFHLSVDDRADIWQDMALAVLSAMRRYDPALASRDTFAERVVSMQYIKTALRIRRDLEREPESASDVIDGVVDPRSERGNPADARLDLEAALEVLPRRLHLIAEDLKTKRPGEIAAEMGVHRSTVHRAISQIRTHLRAHGVGIFED